MAGVTPEPCFLCGNPPMVMLGYEAVGGADVFGVCESCYAVCCLGSDTNAAELFRAIKESQSSGYTDKAFAHTLWEAGYKLGFQLLAIDVWLAGNGNLIKSGFLGMSKVLAAPPKGFIIHRSRRPATPSLFDHVASKYTYVETSELTAWDSYGTACILKENQTWETNPAVVEIAMSAELDRLPFASIANMETSPSYELIRRCLL